MFDVQIFGVLNVMGRRFRCSGATVAGTSSTSRRSWGSRPSRAGGLYSAGKFALEALTEALAAEVADLGIGVNLIEPGYVRTDFLTKD
ncbi:MULTISPECIES: SDR family NAD(P)-dependent oxidoreductase [Rhodococcus]|uniref:Short-chain dehydrogenase n=1 Tax=Rhodococcus pyridinivorans SB3094 TaxID=1435356 RepID=V9XK86_9NOCA|nr:MULTISPECIES: SDR family NAD(P)-dependent oxidoreductase [Rhodococcus]AHD23871.1 hypothetical protein Y013_18370 [Rhodococcus pyridinivorans SB3094]MCT7293221.1 SDR family NAD(P)-dependent oxidoreductase [Rhodococcus sp. PAE-6]